LGEKPGKNGKVLQTGGTLKKTGRERDISGVFVSFSATTSERGAAILAAKEKKS